MSTNERILVYGATGHTGRFVVDELQRRGVTPVLAGRGSDGMAAVTGYASFEKRVARVDDPVELGRATDGMAVVINCAGPFLDTALPLARAAVAAGAHYLDVTAEQAVVQALYRELDAPARAAGVAVIPAMAFYGGLADLLVTTALGEDAHADEVDIAIGLDRWWPTAGTRATGARNTATRVIIRNGTLVELPDSTPGGTWSYSELLGEQPVVAVPFSEVITIARHLQVRELRSHLNTAPLDDLRDSDTPAPSPDDPHGRSAQRFVMDVVARVGDETRRIGATGRDIYAVSAALVVEGAMRLFESRHRGPGAGAPGEKLDAISVLGALHHGSYPFSVQGDRAAVSRVHDQATP